MCHMEAARTKTEETDAKHKQSYQFKKVTGNKKVHFIKLFKNNCKNETTK